MKKLIRIEVKNMQAKWIYTEKPKVNTRFIFKKEFNAKGEILNFEISANSRYRLYINNEFVCEGPCKTDEKSKCFEKESFKLKNGKNEIKVEVLYITNGYAQVYPGAEPSLYFNGKYGENELVSDESFLVAKDLSIKYVKPNYCNFVHHSIIFDANKEELSFKNAKILYEPKDGGCTPYGILDKYFLKEREIPQMVLEKEKSFKITKTNLNINGTFKKLKADKNFFAELDLGKYQTYYPTVIFKANKGAKIKITYSESYYPKGFKDVNEKDNRCDLSGVLFGDSDVIISNGKEITFTPDWFRSGRFIRLEGKNIESIEIRSFTYRFYHYPLNIVNNFVCSDEEYNKMWKISINTLLCCMQETYVDCPYYEQQQYIMDTSLDMMYTYMITNDLRLPKKTIDEFSKAITHEGLILCNYPSKDLQIIPGFSLFFVYMVKNYILFSGDKKFGKKYIPQIESILNFFDGKICEKGYVGATGYWAFVDWGKDWKRGVPADPKEPLTYYSLLYSNALLWAEEIYRISGRENSAKDLKARRLALNEAINRYCTKDGFYTDTPKGKGLSEHCQVLAILGDVCKKPKELMKKTMEGNLTQCSFSMSFFLLRALEKCGMYSMADRLLDKWRYVIGKNSTTWGESVNYTRSDCHGWGSVMLYDFPSVILGVKPVLPGYEKFEVKPFAENIDFAEGTIPTPLGNISVKFEKKDKKIHLTVDSPKKSVTIIGGKEYKKEHVEVVL